MKTQKTYNSKTFIYPLGLKGRLLASACLCGLFAVGAQANIITANLVVQLDGSNVSTTGSLVDSWNDQAGVAQNFTQSGLARPTLLTGISMVAGGGSFNVVDFEDEPNNLTLAATTAFNNMDLQSWYMVVRLDDAGTQTAQGVYGVQSSGHATKITTSVTGGNVGLILRDAGGAQQVNVGNAAYAPADGEWILLSGRWNMTGATVNGLSAVTSTFGVHDSAGVLQSSGSDIASGLFGTHVRSVLGGRGDLHGARDMDGAIAEFLLYDDVLSSADQAETEQYLINKYFVAVPEPSSLALMAMGFGALLFFRRSQRS